MRTFSDYFLVRYKRRNKNVFVGKSLNIYIDNLVSRFDKNVLNDYQAITNAKKGTHQTPLSQINTLLLLSNINKSKNILEVGTFKGFTSLCFALYSSKDTTITTLELDKTNIEYSKKLWKKYKQTKNINLIEGDALQNLSKLHKGFDFIYIDADKINYPRYYKEALRLTSPGGIILLDNMLWAGLVAHSKTTYSHAAILNNLNQEISNNKNISSSLIPAWDGLMVIYV